MKKLMFFAFVLFLGYGSSHAQGDLKLGFNAGIPTGDLNEDTSFQVGADIAYLFSAAGIVKVGPMIGYSRFFGQDELDDASFIPIAASGRVNLALFFVGLDLGYALATEEGMDQGLYYRPKIGFGIGLLNLIASYSGISADGATISSLNLGVELTL